jgi:glutamine---fructose-6-phosphate transaminase (isomerizing)
MSSTYSVTKGLYVSDILEQPEVLQRTLSIPLPDSLHSFAAKVREQESPFVLLTGMGSSFHALRPLAVRLAEAGIRALLLETSELIYYWANLLQQDVIVLAVSQSGRSAEMVRLIEINAGRAPILCVTNDASSPLAHGSDSVILIDAGTEATVSCKTYTCTLLALSRIGEVLSGGNVEHCALSAISVPGLVSGYLSTWRDHVDELLELLQHTRQMILVGRGPSLATTGAGGLIIKEAARFHAEGMSAAAFRHGPLEMVNRELFVLVFKGDERSAEMNTRLATEVRTIGGNAELVSEASPNKALKIPEAGDLFRPIMEMLPVQMMTLALAAQKGLEAGSFVHISKVTSIE